MSASESTNNHQTPIELDPPFLKFPPFPEPPPGVAIMSFKEFKPRGIQLFAEPNLRAEDEDDELDALGIPTVELRVKHATDECKSNSRKKRKKKKASADTAVDAVPVKRLPWYNEWEEGEDLRVTRVRYDPNIPPVDRFFQSAYDFRTGRPWPPVTSGLNSLWDHFRLFTGLLVNPSVYRKVGAKRYARAESPDFITDNEDDPDDPPMNTKEDDITGPAKRQRSSDVLDDDNNNSLVEDPHKLDEDVREEMISIFLNDPEKEMRIFLSSYMREHGLIWTERNLIFMPRLVSFFLAFVVRNHVLLEPAYQRGLKRALEMIELAKKELPLTHKVGYSIPDAVNDACRECFGRQGGMNWSVVEGVITTTDQKGAAATITNTDLSTGVTTKITLPTEAEVHLKDAIEDNVDDIKVSLAATSTVVSPNNEDTVGGNSDSWREGGWGNESGTGWGDGWSQNIWGEAGTWGDNTQQGRDANPIGPDNQWAASNPSWGREFSSLISLLGPSAFPMTHTTGIIEFSTRRVCAIHFPPNHPNAVPLLGAPHSLGTMTGSENQSWRPSADGVEAELDTRFAKVTLEPWGREEGDIAPPEIWRTSRGPVIDPNNKKAALTEAATSKRKPHDPLTDNISLLVVPSFAETLLQVPGLGLGAMWIEIARQKVGVAEDSGGGPAQVDYDTPGRFWYHEDVTGIFPSFYTTRQE